MCDVLDKLLANIGDCSGQIKTEGQARAAYDCYMRIRHNGFHVSKESYKKPTWQRHVKNLRSVGLVAADLQPINVVPLRRRQIVLDQPVSSWDQINLAIGA